MRDQESVIKNIVAQKIVEQSGDATVVGEAIDRTGFESVSFLIQAGTVTAGLMTPKIQHSDNGTDWTEVDDEYLTKLESAVAIDTTDQVEKIGYVGEKRYCRFDAVFTGTADMTISVQCLLGNSNYEPVV